MLGVLLTVLFSVVAALAGMQIISRWSSELDQAEKAGLGGLVGLGAAGLLTLLLGLLPGGLGFALYVVLLALVVLAALYIQSSAFQELKFRVGRGLALLATAALALIGLIALVAVLAPSLSTDWDSIAYHLAVPKLWLQQGQIGYVQGIHHSNFPSTMEMLFMWGIKWGGQAGAKAFSLIVYVFGAIALFGVARRWYGNGAGWWAALGFAGIPVVAWESGTAYIDVAHGLFAAFAILYVCELFKKDSEHKTVLVLAGICLGFTLGTKYTGLQVMASIGVVVALAGVVQRRAVSGLRPALIVTALGLIIASPWYLKTLSYTGNPVYPFFYSVLGGRDWDAWRASVYTAEQKTFGVGNDLTNIGHGVLGLAYQPGRYTNPLQDVGGGFPTGAIGFACLLAGVSAAVCGRLRREERLVLAVVGVCFLMWFVLSQQSRYLTMLAIPLAVLGAGQVARVKWGGIVAFGFVLQSAVSVFMINKMQTSLQLQTVMGGVSQEDYLRELMPFYRDAEVMNQLPEGSKVALYDQVFGFYLDVPYFWANPGHSMMIPYEGIETPEDYVREIEKLGFTHVYLGTAAGDQRFFNVMRGADAYSAEERAQMFPDLNTRWRIMITEAVQKGYLRPETLTTNAALYRVVR